MKLFVYDNEETFIEDVRKMVKKNSRIGQKVELYCISDDANSVLNHVLEANSSSYEPNLYLIETYSRDDVTFDGLELARRVRTIDPLGYIVFVSNYNYKEYCLDYSIKPFRYFMKPMGLGEMTELVNQIEEDFENIRRAILSLSNSNVIITCERKPYVIPVNQIVAVEHKKPKTIVYTLTENVRTNISLKQFMDQIALTDDNETFIHTHKSFLVNLNNVKGYDNRNNVFKTINGLDVPVSRSNRDDSLLRYDKIRHSLLLRQKP